METTPRLIPFEVSSKPSTSFRSLFLFNSTGEAIGYAQEREGRASSISSIGADSPSLPVNLLQEMQATVKVAPVLSNSLSINPAQQSKKSNNLYLHLMESQAKRPGGIWKG